jgi:hypothetical protein
LHVFEKTFGIDDLQSVVRTIEEKRNVMTTLTLKNNDYDPKADKYIFSHGELEKYIHMLEEFKFRHGAISYKIEETYLLGNKMLEYLER